MIHALITFIICIVIFLIKLPFILFFFPVMFYVGREHAQAEYRYIASHGGKRANCPSWCGFLPSAWTRKGLSDFLFPLIVAVIIYVAAINL